jgi:hypothetical protein
VNGLGRLREKPDDVPAAIERLELTDDPPCDEALQAVTISETN